MTVDQDRVKALLHYDPDTGAFTYLKTNRRGRNLERSAGFIDGSTGYLRITVDGRMYYAHRLAILYMTGEWPPHQVDHKDCVRSNNSWKNLRLATSAENKRNRVSLGRGPKGLKGVSRDRKRFCAQIYLGGRKKFLGNFDTPEAAHEAYCAAAKLLFGEFAREA